ncbi:hypothetical protein [Novilysobacter avium]|uniref:Uncharacterized protein n=1 Tax=Novilysobacter avium TaxID=2781023 RepID=A0A7S6UK15_9GAMM|nr:hypothetical protein [Lysobacter avium]QOW21676.1 hypothetical protein INQ42_10630 [Lysobacter avium]
MKNIFFVVALTMLLSACGGSGNNPVETSSVAAPASGEPSGLQSDSTSKRMRPKAAADGDKGVDKLVAMGLVLDFPHAINYDIIDESRNGTIRHRVLVEVLGADFPAAVQQFDDSIVALGYARKDGVDEGGKSKSTYVKKGVASLYILAQPVDVGPDLKNPDALGSIHIMWNKGR